MILKKDTVVIGLGKWGLNHVRILSSINRLEGVFDLDQNKIKNISKIFSCYGYESLDDINNNKEIKNVFIITSASSHFSVLKKLNKKNNFFIEKPISANSTELDELRNLLKENNLKIASGHLLNYHPAISVIKDLIKNDYIGDVINIKSFRHNFGRFRIDENVVSSFMPHDLSLIFNFFKNEKIIDKQLFKWRILSPVQDDEARLFLKFDNNKTAIVSNLWTNHKKRHELIITGNKGMIIFDDNEKNINKKIKLIQFEFYSENNHSLPKISTEDYVNINSVAKPLNVEIDQSLKYFDGEIDFIVNSFEESYKILSFIFNLSKQNANLRLVK